MDTILVNYLEPETDELIILCNDLAGAYKTEQMNKL
jgi:hypothetical protein